MFEFLKRRLNIGSVPITAPEAEPPAVPVPPPPPPPKRPLSPLEVAMGKTPDLNGCVQVIPPGEREHATGFTLKVSKLDPTDVAGFCRDNPIFHPTDLEPPADLSFADRAAYLAVLRGMKEWDRALLYEKGGMPLIRETILLAMKKLAEPKTTIEKAP